jgi:hypothetical protein
VTGAGRPAVTHREPVVLAYAGAVATRRLLEPSRLAPVQVDLPRVFLVGTVLWLVALAVTGTLAAMGGVTTRTVLTCATGAGLGVLAILWARHRGPRS